LVFYGEDTVDISTVHHWIKKWSGMSVGATHNFNRQKYDMVWYDIYLIAIGLTPGGSSTHLHTNNT
jgi:hypothetical protein